MRKRILILSVLVSAIGIVVLSCLFVMLMYKTQTQQADGQLKNYMKVFETQFSEQPFTDETAKNLSQTLNGVRVTYLSADGMVRADSVEGDHNENHSNREEVSEALLSGEGFAVRKSSVTRQNSAYFCRRFVSDSAGTGEYILVRMAIPAQSVLQVAAEAAPTAVWFLVFDIIGSMFAIWLALPFMLRPIDDLTQAAARTQGELETDCLDLQPLAKMMNKMNADLHGKVKKMEEDRRIEKLILNSIEHGIVIFRDASDVILINRTARRLLDYEVNEPIACFSSDREIATVLESGENAFLVRKIKERYYNYRFTRKGNLRVLLITDVTELTAAEHSKNDFIANVTHEMNTPLTSIRGFAELIETGTMPPEKLNAAARTIIRQSDRLSNLIRSIINFSQIDSDELPDYEVNLSQLLQSTATIFEPHIAERKLNFTTDISPDVVVMSRRERLTEVVNNLISNAVKYNREGGDLNVTLVGGETPVLRVEDTGIGLSEEDKKRVFERFYTVDKSHNGLNGGFGLGLAVVKKLCRRAGWKLSVESELGKGTAFTIEFCKH